MDSYKHPDRWDETPSRISMREEAMLVLYHVGILQYPSREEWRAIAALF
jgi:hypothetical protein